MAQTRFTGPVKSDAGFRFDTSNSSLTGVGDVTWNPVYGTINIGMPGGVTQQVGMETYIYVDNATGSTIPNGTVVSFGGVNGLIEAVPFDASGVIPALYLLGVTTQDIASGGSGYVTVFGEVHELNTSVWQSGDILYADPAVPGGLTAVKPTAPNAVVVVAAVLVSGTTDGALFIRTTIPLEQFYGDFSRMTNMTVPTIDTAYTLEFTSTEQSNGVVLGTPASRVVVPESGLYRVQANIQLSSSSSSAKAFRAWYRKNGVDVPNSARLVTVSENNGFTQIILDLTASLNANDYIEIVYSADSTNVTLNAVAATGYSPAGPSVRMTITQAQL